MALLTTIFLMPSSTKAQVDTFVCDNGGFEQDFLYYKFFLTSYHIGSNDCNPTNFINSVTWSNWPAPNPYRFEIVNSGVDQLVGIVERIRSMSPLYEDFVKKQNKK